MVGLGSVNNTSDVNKPISTATQTALDLKAPLASPAFTGTVAGVTKSMVGLGDVDNATDANKPVSTAQQTALDLKSNIASPIFTGTSTIPTAQINTLSANTALVSETVNTKMKASPTSFFMSPSTYCGVWMVNESLTCWKFDKMYPILCSIKDFGKIDDLFIVTPGYQVNLYYYTNKTIIHNRTQLHRSWSTTTGYNLSGITPIDGQIRTIGNKMVMVITMVTR